MKRQPNILLIQTDQQKATSLDIYNPDSSCIETVNLRKLADEGVVYNKAYCAYPLCIPSRISMLTGMHPSSSGYIANLPYPLKDKHPTLFSQTFDHGYRNMLVGKDHAIGLGCKPCPEADEYAKSIFARTYNGGFGKTPELIRDIPEVVQWIADQPVLNTLWGSEVAPWNNEKSITGKLTDVALEYLNEWENEYHDQPFAMWLSYPDPHEKYQCPKDMFDSIDPDSIQLPPNWESDIGNRAEFIQFFHWYFNAGGPIPEETVKKLIRVYLAMCKNIDHLLGRVFDWLQETREWENTIIIYTSDHGDFNGDHQLLQKFNCGYDGCCRVPFIASWPGHSLKNVRCNAPVSLIDIPATIAELLGWKTLPKNQGQSFATSLMSDPDQGREFTVTESGVSGEHLTTRDIANFTDHRYDIEPEMRWCYDPPHRFGGKMYAIRSRDYKLIVREEDKPEFYDMKNDPWECCNAIAKPELQAQVLKHYQYLAQHLTNIAPVPDCEVRIADQDAIYRAGENKTWQECVKAAKEKK